MPRDESVENAGALITMSVNGRAGLNPRSCYFSVENISHKMPYSVETTAGSLAIRAPLVLF